MRTNAWSRAWNAPSLVLALTAIPFGAFAAEAYSPHIGQSYPDNVYWGDTHVHTALSVDGYIFGNRLMPDDAYRFAKGEKVQSPGGGEVRLRRPLDFLMVSDHAENMGVIARIDAGDESLLETEAAKLTVQSLDYPVSLVEALNADSEDPLNSFNAATLRAIKVNQGLGEGLGFADYGIDEGFRHTVWNQVVADAEEHNEPGTFTTFVGYEWTGRGHRNVLFADGPELTSQIAPFSSLDSNDPEDMWAFLHDYEERLGGRALAIPHNGNLSGNRMFGPTTHKGEPFTETYARARSRWEPLYEVTQIKGDGESHPLLSPTDEFADYEVFKWGVTLSQPDSRKPSEGSSDAKEQAKSPSRPQQIPTHSYARSALKLGLAKEVELGANPFKFGMVGSTDSHTALATADQDNFWGKMPGNEPSRNRVSTGWNYNAAGYAAVWAEENTREALFAAMRRKEVYASTGPRITVRFFGGWGYSAADAAHPDMAQVGYARGVPMGGDLTAAPEGKAPSFLIRAVKDPDGANLDRVQVIKGWRDEGGEVHERIYNVALSDGRAENGEGEVEPVGSTVDVAEASYTNSIGDPELAVVWIDPDFDPDELAFYYLRVLEIPTPRWTAYDAKFYGLEDLPDGIPTVAQQRAYTSPIWYTPM